MSVQFAVLSSGSRGNATLIRSAGAGLLVDFGVGPKRLKARLASVGAEVDHIAAAILTHTHGDHADGDALALLAKSGVALYCHEGHRRPLMRFDGFLDLDRRGLVRHFDEAPVLLPNGARVEPFRVPHGSSPTFGFRVEVRPGRGKHWVEMGYLTDLGHWTDATADALADVHLLAVEFNHDVAMQWNSGRHPALIARNLGGQGHLSNEQGAGLLRAVLDRSGPGRLKNLVLLHLSEQCNRPDLALKVARLGLRDAGARARLHATGSIEATPDLRVAPGARPSRAPAAAEPGFPWEAA